MNNRINILALIGAILVTQSILACEEIAGVYTSVTESHSNYRIEIKAENVDYQLSIYGYDLMMLDRKRVERNPVAVQKW